MSPEAEMLRRHHWRVNSSKRVGCMKHVWWRDPVTGNIVEQWWAVPTQRKRNRQARAAKREAKR